MERDWDKEEGDALMLVLLGDHPHIVTCWQAALAERRRLAELLTWRPGPPTEPGRYALEVTVKDGLPFQTFGEVPLADGGILLFGSEYRYACPEHTIRRHFKIPQPPSEEAANGKD